MTELQIIKVRNLQVKNYFQLNYIHKNNND